MKFARLKVVSASHKPHFLQTIQKKLLLCSMLSPFGKSLSERENSMKNAGLMASPKRMGMVEKNDGDVCWYRGCPTAAGVPCTLSGSQRSQQVLVPAFIIPLCMIT